MASPKSLRINYLPFCFLPNSTRNSRSVKSNVYIFKVYPILAERCKRNKMIVRNNDIKLVQCSIIQLLFSACRVGYALVEQEAGAMAVVTSHCLAFLKV